MELRLEEVSVKDAIDGRSETSESSIADDEFLVENLARDYTQYLNFDLSKEQNKFSDSIEDMLTKLDEFCGLVDMIRSDTTLCLTKTLPEIQLKCDEMQNIFQKIDRLEAFVGVVKHSVSNMEECISKAEDDMGSFGGIMKKLSSIVSPKKGQVAKKRNSQPSFTPPTIFQTSQYLLDSTQDPQIPSTGEAIVESKDQKMEDCKT